MLLFAVFPNIFVVFYGVNMFGIAWWGSGHEKAWTVMVVVFYLAVYA